MTGLNSITALSHVKPKKSREKMTSILNQGGRKNTQWEKKPGSSFKTVDESPQNSQAWRGESTKCIVPHSKENENLQREMWTDLKPAIRDDKMHKKSTEAKE